MSLILLLLLILLQFGSLYDVIFGMKIKLILDEVVQDRTESMNITLFFSEENSHSLPSF